MPKSKRGKQNSNPTVDVACETCGDIHTRLTVGELADKIPDFKKDETHYLQGLCAKCKKDLEEGCVFFKDEKGRCVKVSAEAAKEKITECYLGKIVVIPVPALTELIKVYLQHHKGNPPPRNSIPSS